MIFFYLKKTCFVSLAVNVIILIQATLKPSQCKLFFIGYKSVARMLYHKN